MIEFAVEMASSLEEVLDQLADHPRQVYDDGLFCHFCRGVGVFIVLAFDEESYYSIRLEFKTTNNEVK